MQHDDAFFAIQRRDALYIETSKPLKRIANVS